MELPHLGQHCALSECNRLDFLPVKCDCCKQVYCLHHYQYDKHQCKDAGHRTNNQVPVCPLCSQPVVGRRNEMPDIAMSQHIDIYCSGNELIKGKRQKIKTNLQACSFRSCKQKDLIYIECTDCMHKFCVKHRHPNDHQCVKPTRSTIMSNQLSNNWNTFKGSCSSSANSGFEVIKNTARQINRSGQAAIDRITNNRNNDRAASSSRPANTLVADIQGNLSEQEALAIAIADSKSHQNGAPTSQTPSTEEEESLALARALHESQLDARRRQTANSQAKESCILS